VEDRREVTPLSLPAVAQEVPHSHGGVDFEGLYRMHAKRIYRLCWRMVWDKADAEDLTQEVFIQVFRKIHTYRGEAAFTTWLHRLAINVVLMRLRKKSRLEPALGEGGERGQKPDHAREKLPAPSLLLTGALDRVDLERALAQLPPGFRHAVILHDVEGYGHSEIAHMLGVSAGTSKSQLHKARLRLRDLLRVAGRPHPQPEAGGRAREILTADVLREKTARRQPWLWAAPGRSLQKTLARARDRAHGQNPITSGAGPRDEFECVAAGYEKAKCA